MSSNGTPQSYLAAQRPNISTMRDMSMDQNNTNTGNPQGYVPPNFARYTPPMENAPNGTWNTGGLQYSLPTSYGSYASSTPPLPKFNPQSIYTAFANAGRQNQFGSGSSPNNTPAGAGVQGRFYQPQGGNGRPGMPMPQMSTQQSQNQANAAQLAAATNPNVPLPQQAGGLSTGPANTNVSQMMQQFQQQQALQAAAAQLQPGQPAPAPNAAPTIPMFTGAGGLSQGMNGRSFMQGY